MTLYNQSFKGIVDAHIMIVDDSSSMAKLIKDILSVAGYRDFYLYTNPLRAIDHIQNVFHPSLIIVDYQMPEMNGVEFIKTVGVRAAYIPVVMVSGNPELIPSDELLTCTVLDKGDLKFASQLIDVVTQELQRGPACLNQIYA